MLDAVVTAGTTPPVCRRRLNRQRGVAAVGAFPWHEVKQLAGHQADDQAGGRRDADPAAAARRDRHGHFAGAAREVEHTGGLAEVGQPVENPRALRFELASSKMCVGFGERGVAPLVGIGRQARELGRAALASATCRSAWSSWSLSGARTTNASAVSRSMGT